MKCSMCGYDTDRQFCQCDLETIKNNMEELTVLCPCCKGQSEKCSICMGKGMVDEETAYDYKIAQQEYQDELRWESERDEFFSNYKEE